MIQIKAKNIQFELDECKTQLSIVKDAVFGTVVHIEYPSENLIITVGESKFDFHMNGGEQLGSVYEDSKEMKAQYKRLKALVK